jgi:hypothetical protein
MPPPNKSLYAQLAKSIFASKAIPLPQSWSQPGSQYPDAFSAEERTTAPNPPTNLFREATSNKYHVDTAGEIGKKFETFVDGICGATCDGIGNWLSIATISGVMINGPVGMLTPGNVIGPPVTPLILATAPKGTPQEMKYSNAVASTFGAAWQAWHAGLTGVLSYPAFAAFPAPIAPPMPNIPVPLVVFASAGEAMLSPGALKGAMTANLGDPKALHATDLFDALSQAFPAVFAIFKASTLVKNVLGTGPIPTFAPPFVPVGPVLGGIGTGPPGCIS